MENSLDPKLLNLSAQSTFQRENSKTTRLKYFFLGSITFANMLEQLKMSTFLKFHFLTVLYQWCHKELSLQADSLRKSKKCFFCPAITTSAEQQVMGQTVATHCVKVMSAVVKEVNCLHVKSKRASDFIPWENELAFFNIYIYFHSGRKQVPLPEPEETSESNKIEHRGEHSAAPLT